MNSTTTMEESLAGHPFLKGMLPAHLAILSKTAREVAFTTNQIIFHQNENAHHFYLVLTGQVAVESYVPRAASMPLQIVAAGDVLGWSWLFPPFIWHFQARALEPGTAIFLDGASLLSACEQNHTFGFEMMERIAQIVIQRLEAAQKRLLEIRMAAGSLPDVEPAVERVPTPPTFHSVQDALLHHPFFSGMESEHIALLATAAMSAFFDKGQVIFQEGDPANRFYLIQHGRVVLAAGGPEAEASSFQIIGDGDVLGWSWLFPPYYSHFEARALEPTQSIFLYGTRVRELCAQNHDLGYALMKRTLALVIQRLQATRLRVSEISEIMDPEQSAT